MTIGFDIYGCYVRTPANNPKLASLLDRNFSLFRTDDGPDKTDGHFTIEFQRSKEKLPIHRKGEEAGVSIHYEPGNRTVTINHNDAVPAAFLMHWTEFLMHWEDKTKMHASAVVINDDGYIFAAPPNTGKTTTVMELLKQGHQFLSDDWVVVGSKGEAYCYPKNIRIFDYNLAYDPEWSVLLFENMAKPVQKWMKIRVLLKSALLTRFLPHRFLKYGVDAALSRPIREVDPRMIGTDPNSKPVDIAIAFWLERGEYASLSINRMDPEDFIDRVTYTYLYEWGEYYKWYFRQGMISEVSLPTFLNDDAQHVRDIVSKTLKNKRVMRVSIPTPTPPGELANEIVSYIQATKTGQSTTARAD